MVDPSAFGSAGGYPDPITIDDLPLRGQVAVGTNP